MNNNYHKAYVEVLEILKYIPIEEKNKLPKKLIETLEKSADRTHKFNLDFDYPFEEQVLLNETKAILAVFYRDYWASDEKKQEIREKEREEIASNSFDYDQLFNKRRKSQQEKSEEENQSLISYEEEKKWYTNFLGFFKKFFKKK